MTEDEAKDLLVRLPLGLKKALKIAAERNDRSMAGLIRKLVKDHLKKEEIPWEEENDKI